MESHGDLCIQSNYVLRNAMHSGKADLSGVHCSIQHIIPTFISGQGLYWWFTVAFLNFRESSSLLTWNRIRRVWKHSRSKWRIWDSIIVMLPFLLTGISPTHQILPEVAVRILSDMWSSLQNIKHLAVAVTMKQFRSFEYSAYEIVLQ